MKKLFYILLVSVAALAVSCSKESPAENNVDAPKSGETITFTASISLNADTKAALDGLNIKWEAGDYIGIATDNSATIVAYPVTPDGVDATKCTITVDAVPGATSYYAIFKGSLGDGGAGVNDRAANDFSDLTFDTVTKTFSGLTVGKQQVASSSLISYLWYTYGFPLSMAGKSNGTTLVMKPCLALFKVQINSESVPAEYYYKNITYTSSKGVDHDYAYSAVRGFDLYQKGASTIYSSGDYTVQIANDGTLTTTAVANENKGEYRQISQSEKLAADTDYIMCLIPGGDVTSFQINFLGYDNNDPHIYWDAPYSMTKTGAMTVTPGSFYNLGKLNPLGRKMAKNQAAWEAEDAFTPAITIDGLFDDWAGVTTTLSDSESYYKEFKVTYDELYLYFYSKRNNDNAIWAGGGYFYYAFDTDSDSGTGFLQDSVGGLEAYLYLYPFSGTSESPVIAINKAGQLRPVDGSAHSFTPVDGSVAGKYDGSTVEIEVRIPRADLGVSKGDNMRVYSWGNKSASNIKTSYISLPLTK